MIKDKMVLEQLVRTTAGGARRRDALIQVCLCVTRHCAPAVVE